MIFAGGVATLALLTACSKNQPAPLPPPAPVTVGTVVEKDMPLEIRAIGNVQAYSTVNVKSQIDGQIQQVNFKEGQFVKRGELLFVIDRRPYEAALSQAEANLARDTAMEQQNKANLARDLAQANYARVEKDRYKDLVRDGVVTKET
ncbi:MAG TPA: biotin/lipoyl-binding protein, partial [Blastocatellia bacterium]|nr:biotin/lipoyl-binding protein [Blastocatellia bacterium]